MQKLCRHAIATINRFIVLNFSNNDRVRIALFFTIRPNAISIWIQEWLQKIKVVLLLHLLGILLDWNYVFSCRISTTVSNHTIYFLHIFHLTSQLHLLDSIAITHLSRTSNSKICKPTVVVASCMNIEPIGLVGPRKKWYHVPNFGLERSHNLQIVSVKNRDPIAFATLWTYCLLDTLSRSFNYLVFGCC
jgi:hypothetical protein